MRDLLDGGVRLTDLVGLLTLLVAAVALLAILVGIVKLDNLADEVVAQRIELKNLR